MKEYLAVTRALSDPNRVRILSALRGGELCVCQLIKLLGLAPSTVSKHLSVLDHAGLVESRKQGRWVHYRLPAGAANAFARRMTSETFRALKGSPQLSHDARQMKSIRHTDLEALCRKLLGKN